MMRIPSPLYYKCNQSYDNNNIFKVQPDKLICCCFLFILILVMSALSLNWNRFALPHRYKDDSKKQSRPPCPSKYLHKKTDVEMQAHLAYI